MDDEEKKVHTSEDEDEYIIPMRRSGAFQLPAFYNRLDDPTTLPSTDGPDKPVW